MRLILPYSFQVVLPSPQFESATVANIDQIFGSNSASDKFYRLMFNLYNSMPGASAATSGDFATPLGCNRWIDPNDPNGLGTTVACAVHFPRNGNAPSDDSIVSGRADWNVGASDRVFLFVQSGRGQTPLHVDPLRSVFNAYCNQSTWQGHLSETRTIGPTASNQFLLGGSFIDGTCSVANSAETLATFPTELSWYPTGVTFTDLGGFDNHYAMPFGSRTTAYQISDDLVKTGGRHKFGFGVNFLRTDATRGGYNRYGTGLLLPQTRNAFFYGGVNPNNPASDYSILRQSYPLTFWNRYAFYTLGLYGQEEWHARANFTVTIALRADHQSNPVCQDSCFARFSGPFNSLSHDPKQPYDSGILAHQKQAFANTDSIVRSPRFSFAWQPLGVSHNSVLRGGVGFFYDPVPGGLATNLGSNPPSYNVYNISGFNLMTSPGGADLGTFRFTVGSISAGVASRGRFANFNPIVQNSPMQGEGVFEKQDPTAFSTAKITGDYAFGVSAASADSSSTKFGAAGRFTASAGIISSGVIDEDSRGTVTSSAAFTGTYSVATNGRGTMTLNVAGAANPVNLVFYVVSSGESLLQNSDQEGTNSLFIGTILQQSGAGSFSNASLNSASVVALNGLTANGPSDVVLGVLNISSAGNFSLVGDENNGGTIQALNQSGTYSVASNGRVTVTGTAHPVVFYLVGANQGFVVGTDISSTTGFLEPQTGAPFSNASATGDFFYGAFTPGVPVPANAMATYESGVASFNGSGSVTGTTDINTGSLFPNQAFTDTYTISLTGRGTMTSSGSIFYFISPSKYVFMNGTAGAAYSSINEGEK